MRSRPALFVILSLTAARPGASQTSSSTATPAATATDAKSREAERLFYAGVSASDRGDPEEARRAFAQSYALSGEPHALRNWGVSAIEAGHWVEGANQLQRYLAARPPGISDEEAAPLQEMLTRAEQKVGRLVFVTDIEGAEVFVDGVPVGTTRSLPAYYTEVGLRTVSARKQGYQAFESRVEAKAGKATVAYIRMDPAATSVPISSPSDQTPAPAAGPSGLVNRTTVTLGLATLTLGAAATWYGAHTARRGAEEDAQALRAAAEQRTGPSHCTGSAAYLDVCQQLGTRVDRLERWDRVATIAEFATFGLAAATVGTWLIWPHARPERAVRVSPWTAAGVTGLQAAGSF